jgi:pimeloyl-ACP methyl ester carboxylesterase
VEFFTKCEWAKETSDELRRIGKRQLLATAPEITYSDYLACAHFDLTDSAAKIKVPALIIGGGADKMTPFQLSEALADKIPNGTLVKIDGAGHKIPMERPQEVAGHITRWVESQIFA